MLPLLMATNAYAQRAPDAGSLLNQQRRGDMAPGSTTPRGEEVLDLPMPDSAAEGTGVQVTVRAIRFGGDRDLASAEKLALLVEPVIGRTLDHAGFQKLADNITRYLRGRGYAVASAYLPRQDVTAGNIEIAILAGRLDDGPDAITVEGHTRLRRNRITGPIASAVRSGRPLRAADLERGLLIVNDLPGMAVRSTLAPGSRPGTTRLIVHAKQDALLSSDLTTDNYGNASTGMIRAGAGLRLVDPLGVGDQVVMGVSLASGSTLLNAGYAVPIGTSPIRLQVAASYLEYDVRQPALRVLALDGSARSNNIGINAPLLRSRGSNLSLALGYERLALEDRALGTIISNRRLDNLSVALSGNRIDAIGGGGLNEAALTLTFGRVDLDRDAQQRLIDQLTARTAGNYAKLSGRVSRLQTLDGNRRWTFLAGVSGQAAGRNLDSSARFLLGGPGGVRAYGVGQGIGDEGVLTTLELRRAIEWGNVQLQGLAFLDGGRIWTNARPWRTGSNTTAFHATGFGLDLRGPNWAIRTAIARRIGRPDVTASGIEPIPDWRGWLQTVVRF